jgi:serine/threonine-protein kinase RsbW
VKHPDIAAFGHRVWPARAGALTLIRGEVRRWLAPLEVMPDAEADLVLAVNEAAANAIDHAYRTGDDTGDDTGDGRAVVEVFFWTEPGAVLLEVVDHGQWRPPGPHAAGGGRGIAIMHRLVEAVLIHHDARGTRVLLRHSLPVHPRTLLPHTASSAARAGAETTR